MTTFSGFTPNGSILFSFNHSFSTKELVWGADVNSIISFVGPRRSNQRIQIMHFHYLHSPWHSVVLPHTDGYILSPFPQHAHWKCQVIPFTCPLIPSNWALLLWKTHYFWIVECWFSTISWLETSGTCSVSSSAFFLCLVTLGHGPNVKHRLVLSPRDSVHLAHLHLPI